MIKKTKIIKIFIFTLMLTAVNILYAAGNTASVHAEEIGHLNYKDSDLYTYDEMKSDIDKLAAHYPQSVSVNNLGKTKDNRDIYELIIGNKEAQNHILLFASIHAREYSTTAILMRQTGEFIEGIDSGGQYKGISYKDLSSNTAIHILPMVNPDGVTLSQLGINAVNKPENKDLLYQIAAMDKAKDLNKYFRRWKSNINGIDLNRNFDALWESYDDRVHHPSSDKYKGGAKEDQIESSILVSLTKKYKFKNTIAYHEQGEVIYWYFGQQGDLKTKTKQFADSIAAVTGYQPEANFEKLDPAGYKDWAIMKEGIPSLTVEVGSGAVPLSLSQFESNYQKNRAVLTEALYFAVKNQ